MIRSASALEDEHKLVERIQDGDALAFRELYDEHAPLVFRYISARVDTAQDAEDLTAEVFINAWKSFSSYSWQGKPVGAWLLRIAHNLIIDRYRQKSKWDFTRFLPWLHKAEEAGFTRIAQRDEISRVLTTLSYEQQFILHMRYFEGYSLKEVAELLDKSPNAVRVAQFRALKRLREALESTNGL